MLKPFLQASTEVISIFVTLLKKRIRLSLYPKKIKEALDNLKLKAPELTKRGKRE
jgi:hypothetical protein